MTDLVVKSAVKKAPTDHTVSAEFYDTLDAQVQELLADAAQRASANDRKTVQPRDLQTEVSILELIGPQRHNPFVPQRSC